MHVFESVYNIEVSNVTTCLRVSKRRRLFCTIKRLDSKPQHLFIKPKVCVIGIVTYINDDVTNDILYVLSQIEDDSTKTFNNCLTRFHVLKNE